MRRLYPDIEELRKQIVDIALIVISTLLAVSLVYIIAMMVLRGFDVRVIFQIFIVALIGSITLFRKRLSTTIKTYLVLFLLLVISVNDTIYWGILSFSAIYLVLMLIFVFGFLSFTKTILLTTGYILVFLFIGYLFHKGILKTPEEYDTPGYASKMLPWIIATIHIVIAVFTLIFVLHKFSSAYLVKINSLQASEAKYRSLSETENTGIWHQNNEGRTEFINDAMCRMLEISSMKEISGLTYLDFLTDESRGIVKRENKGRLEGHSSTYEVVLICKSGARKNVIVTGSPLFDPDNNVIGSIGTFIDITGIRKTESDLAESEKRFREMTELLPQVVFESDIKGVLTYVNKNGQNIFGIYEDEIKKGVTILSTIDPLDHDRVKTNIGKVIAEGHHGGNEYTMVKKDGSRFPALIYSSPIFREGKYSGLRGTIVDITERKKAEEVLISSEKWFRDLINLTPYGVAINDLDGRYLLVNRKLLNDMGYTTEEVIGKTVTELGLRTDEETSKRIMAEIDKNGMVENMEVDIRLKDGSLMTAYFSSKLITFINGNPAVLTTTIDITEKKRLEKELEKHRNHLEELVLERTEAMEAANEELTATNEELYNQREELQKLLNALNEAQQKLIESEKMASVGVLAAGISHEINNPLNFIQGGLYALEDYYKNNLGDHRQGLEPLFQVIGEGVTRASEIVSSLNHFSRRTESQNENCELHKIIDNCLTMLKNQLKHKVTVNINYADNKIFIKGNEGKLHQAILNIIMNSAHSIEDKGEITIKTEVQKNNLLLTITDNGCGISPDNLPRIFDPFFTTKDPGKGTGLGLSITYNIIKDHSGDISIKSTPGKGTTVIIRLPVTA